MKVSKELAKRIKRLKFNEISSAKAEVIEANHVNKLSDEATAEALWMISKRKFQLT